MTEIEWLYWSIGAVTGATALYAFQLMLITLRHKN
jgi:hypothetical protein